MRDSKLKKFCLITILVVLPFLVVISATAQDAADEYYNYATNYFTGENGFEENVDKAKIWYLKAAEAGHVRAQDIVGSNYYSGKNGFSKDRKKAITWLTKAAEAGNLNAQVSLFHFYSKGANFFQRSRKKANHWHAQVLENDKTGGSILRMARLILYLAGPGSQWISQEELRKIFLLAANKGSASAQCQLAEMYEKGLRFFDIFELDRAEAISWYKKAALQGNTNAIEILKKHYAITAYKDGAPGSSPEIFPCPQTNYKLIKNKNNLESGMIIHDPYSGGGAKCTYQNGNTLYLSWTHYKDPLNVDFKWSCNSIIINSFYGPQISILVQNDERKISLDSGKALASVDINLSSKEFAENNRQKWIDLGKDLLPLVEARATSCQKYLKRKKRVETDNTAKLGSTKKRAQQLPSKSTEKKAPEPSTWDSWDAPSPKAKSSKGAI